MPTPKYNEPEVHHIKFKRHHKIIFGSITSIIVISLIVIGIMINAILTTQNLNYNSLDNKISELSANTQSKINELTQNIIDNQNKLNSLNTEVGSIGENIGSIEEKFEVLKSSASADFSDIIENSIRSVVTIKTDIGQGTGFILTDDGYIVTNAHVLSGGNFIQAITYEQKTINAGLVGYNTDLDVALLKISGDYSKLKLADSNDIQIGEKVIAIGNPLGLQFSVSEGIVSATHRPGPNNLNTYIQTDAALNPGNSGGPLINKEGEVIGINNFKVGGGESLGFALESNYIKEAVNKIALDVINQTLI